MTFVLTSLIIVATPGTGALFTIAAGLSRGRRASLVAAAGCTLGTLPHLVAAVTGTAALLRASGLAFETVKFLGVGYLIWMAWSTWRDSSVLAVQSTSGPVPARTVVTRAVLVNLLNPKLTIFFFAFLPQFVPADSPHALSHMLGLSAVFMLLTFVVFAAYGVCAAATRTHLLERPALVDRVRKVFSVSFVALGARLAMTGRE
nr:LysE family translocator [Motilibacter peucedani]